MPNLITYVDTLFRPYYTIILVILLTILFLGVARYTYETYFAKKIKNKDFTDVANIPDTKSQIVIFFFFVDWCPHCLKAKPEWNTFKQQYSDKIINGYVIKTYDIDCTDDNGDQSIPYYDDNNHQQSTKLTSLRTSEIIRKYKIESYPTIKMIKDDTIIEFDAKLTNDNLTKFVNSV